MMTREGAGLPTATFAGDYRTGRSDPVMGFYEPCLHLSSSYDRAVGYFRSSIYLIVGAATLDFAREGGRIRLVCSPSLYADDAHAIDTGYAEREGKLTAALLREIDEMLEAPGAEYRTRILATLVKSGALDIKLAVRPDSNGIYHEKVGIFRDAKGNAVSFIGSANETWNAWHQDGNFESIEVFCSWRDDGEARRVARHQDDFQRLWDGDVPGLRVVPFPEAARERFVQTAFDSLPKTETQPAPRRRPPPLPYQTAAVEEWKRQGCRGVLEHATGSGKTVTALLAIREHISKGLPCLILVPSRLLLAQWASEIRSDLQRENSGLALLLAGDQNNSWKQGRRLKGMTGPDSGAGPRVVLATMQTAATAEFRAGVAHGAHLMVVADEVHQIGSSFNSHALGIDTGPRLGLSATARRYGDPDGTARIFNYFGPCIPPPVTLQDAITAGRLVEYTYHPHPVHLTAEETDAWKELTTQIGREIARTSGGTANGPIGDRARMMLIKRSRIAKKALNKVRLAVDTIRSGYEDDHRWLVYCEDREQLRQVMNGLIAVGLSPSEYHTGMQGDRDATLDWFKNVGGILISIRCLDEGVDIPSVDHAFILASSQNPRQFIQRRGRVLRKAPDKFLAHVHDAIVVPISIDQEPEQVALLKSELLRALEFSDAALNKGAGAELRAIATRLGFDPDATPQAGLEEDE